MATHGCKVPPEGSYRTRAIALCMTSCCLPAAAGAGASVRDLRCEYRVDPLGIDATRPRLSWILESGERGVRQTAYRILVAGSEANLTAGRGDLWDSGKVRSDRSVHIEYAGRPLTSCMRCYWKVRVWSTAGPPAARRPGTARREPQGRSSGRTTSAWSKPSTWTMGLLKPGDWKAKWIESRAPETDVPLEKWLWHPDALKNTNSTVFFRRVIHVDERVARVVVAVTADDRYALHVNGRKVGEGANWQSVERYVLTRRDDLRRGPNVIGIEASNAGTDPRGMICGVRVDAGGAGKGRVASGSSSKDTRRGRVLDATGWECSTRKAPGWLSAELGASGWVGPAVIADYGGGPWGKPRASGRRSLPIFRREFTVARRVERATVCVCGLGQYELFLNGGKVGDSFLDPSWSVYEKTVYYDTFDVTRQVKTGANAFGVMLGKGFYNTRGDRRVHGVRSNRPLKLILQALVEYEDGSSLRVATDESWRTAEGPITHCAVLAGSDFDARLLPSGWDMSGFDPSSVPGAWAGARVTSGPGGRLTAACSPPLKAFEVFRPKKIDEPDPGVFVYDFGQNASAVPRVRVRGRAGQTLRLTPAEQRHGQSKQTNNGSGRVNQAGVGRPNYWEYTLRGPSPRRSGSGRAGGTGEEAWQPQFTYGGFQYVEVTGAVPGGSANPRDLPVIEELVSVHVRSASPVVGSFECSNPLFNRIDRLIDWAVRSNLSHVLTDCPHREKLGWLEVSYLMGPAIARRYDIARLYAKKARDIRDSQDANGAIYTVAPNYPAFGGGFRYTPEWGAAGVVVPWQLYRWYGDERVLEDNYEAMKGFVDFMRSTSRNLVPRPGLGDWYDYGHGKRMGPSRFTPVDLTAAATFYRCSDIVARTAEALGRGDDHRRYRDLADEVRKAFNRQYFNGKDAYKNHGSPQTANAMALALGLTDSAHERAVLDAVVADIRKRGNQQTAGDIGFHYLVEALARHGRHDVIFDIASRREEGSYGFILDRGWTSMPEAWNANTSASMNHCMLGHIQQWFYHYLLGIRQPADSTAFKRILIRPACVAPGSSGEGARRGVVEGLAWVKGHYDSVHGRIASDWRVAGGRLTLNVTIPANTTATVVVPARRGGRSAAGGPAGVTEGGRPAAEAPCVTFVERREGAAVYRVGSGTYSFASPFGKR